MERKGRWIIQTKKIAVFLALAVTALLYGTCELKADSVSADTNFIDRAYSDLLGRPASSSDLSFDLILLQSETRAQLALGLDTSAEYYQKLANSYFQSLLGRSASLTELNGAVTSLGLGVTDEQLQASLAGSAEFFSHAGGTDAGFVNAVFSDFLDRPPSFLEATEFESELAAMTSTRQQEAGILLGSLSYDDLLVNSYYELYLGRPGTSSEIAGFASELNGGIQTDEQVIAAIIGSQEYFDLAQPKAETPEPPTVALLFIGIVGLLLLRRQLSC